MNNKIKMQIKEHEILLFTILAGIIGAVVFILIYGVQVLDVTKDAWLFDGGDLTQHYAGWAFFRNCEWKFPIGLFNTLTYPNYGAIIFTDSIPLFAIIFKVFSSILPETFQYFGIYGFMCYILQGVFAFTLLRKFIKNRYYTICRNSIFYYFTIFASKNVWSYSPFSKLFIACWILHMGI